MLETLISKVAIIGTFGIGAQWLAWRTQVPAIILLLIAGLLAGPVTGAITPYEDFGQLFRPLIAVAVAIILFEGGLTLNFKEIRDTTRAVTRIAFIGAPLAWLLSGLAAYYVADLSLEASVIFGGIMVVTGPTVIMPLLRQARLPQRVSNVLRWEAIIVDPIGALFAVIGFEVVAALTGGHNPAEIAVRLAGALILAGGGGYLVTLGLVRAFARGYVPDYLKSAVLMIAVVVAYALTNAVLEEAGLMTVTVMGLVLANSRLSSLTDLRRFKETMTVLLVSGVFVVLTASVTKEQLFSLGWRDLAFTAVLLFVVRPLTIAVASAGTELSFKERMLVGWIAPRGVVAVAVSGLFATALTNLGVVDGERLAPLAFSIVLATVVLHGFSIGPLARLLGLTMKTPPGVLIVGSGRFALGLAGKLKETGVPVMIADRNWNRLRQAREAGISIYFGEILSEAAEHNVDFGRFGSLVAATDNDAYNALVCTDFGPEIGRADVYQIGRTDHTAPDRTKISFTLGGRTLIEGAPSVEDLEARIRGGWTFQKTRLTDEYTYARFREERGVAPLVMFIAKPSGRIVFATAEGDIKPETGDTIFALGPGRLGGEPSAVAEAAPQGPLP